VPVHGGIRHIHQIRLFRTSVVVTTLPAPSLSARKA
jgi:hypothetical protein